MGSIRVLAGRKFNPLERGIVTVSSEDALFPRSLLYDGRPSRPFRFAAAGTNDHVTVDTCLTQDPGFESWVDATTPEKWTKSISGTGSVDREATIVDSGTYACKLAVSTDVGLAMVEQFVWARAGEDLYVSARGRAAGVTLLQLYVGNVRTGKWLTSGSGWGNTFLPFATTLATSFQTLALAFQVEGMDACLEDVVPLRLIARFANPANSPEAAYVDNFRLLPAIDFASIHGHNIDRAVDVELRSSSDPTFASSTLRATLTKRIPAFYGLLGSPVSTDQHWRFLFGGGGISAINSVPISLGEVVLGRALTLARRPDYGWEIKRLRPDVATETPTGEVYSSRQSKWSRRVLGMQFKFFATTEMEQQAEEVFERCEGRGQPLVIVPDDTRPEVLHGRIDRSWAAKRRLVNAYDDTSLIVSESPFEVATL